MSDYDESWRFHWGKWVKARAKFLGLRLKVVAEKTGTSPINFSRWVKSKDMPPLREDRDRHLAETLQIHAEELPHAHLFHSPDEVGYIELTVQPTSGESFPDFIARSDKMQRMYEETHAPTTPQEHAELRSQIHALVDQLDGVFLGRVHLCVLLEIAKWSEWKANGGDSKSSSGK